MTYKRVLILLYAAIWLVLAVNPTYRSDWFLENLLVFAFIPVCAFLEKRFNFSILSSISIFVFLVLHSVGAHYTYAEMPYFFFITEFFHFSRNHYDRLVHFLFGLLMSFPMFEVFEKAVGDRKNAALLTVLTMFSFSSFYELLEWWVTELVHPELGMAFLGIQGDEWDAQKDVNCALIGILLSVIIRLTLMKSRRPTVLEYISTRRDTSKSR